jgi:GNAT superfamily N-acetyltransferase
MIDPLVRPASVADTDQLRWLESVSRATLVEQRGGRRWLDTHPERGENWPSAITSTSVFVAEIDDVIVGYLVASMAEELLAIDEVFVQVEARELGFGDALLAEAIAAGRQAGMRLLEGEALPGDRDTKNLYERAGIKARLITVSTEL